MKRYLGMVDYNGSGRRNCKACISWELKDGENGPVFSAQAEIWNPRETDIYCGGQCVDTVAAFFPQNAWAQRVVEIWKKYHLNDMRPGLPVQEEAVRKIEAETVEKLRTETDSQGCFYDLAKTDPNWHAISRKLGFDSHYSLMCNRLDKLGLYQVRVPAGIRCHGGFPALVMEEGKPYQYGERGYRYGERWIYSPIPEEILAEIRSWGTEGETP